MGLPLFIREYIVLVACSIVGYLLFLVADRDKIYFKWTVLWILVLTAAYFSRSFFLFIGLMGALCLFGLDKRPQMRVVYYFLLLPALPSHVYYELGTSIPGIRYLFAVTYPRLLTLFILLPIAISVKKGTRDSKLSFFSRACDKYVVAYLLFLFFLAFRGESFTNAFRICFDNFIDIFVPYYAISRCIKDAKDIKKIFTAILFSAVILSCVGIFEHFKFWHLYDSTLSMPHMQTSGFGSYFLREGLLRVPASMGHPIAFAFFLVIAGGIMLHFIVLRGSNNRMLVAMGLILGALYFTLSRGPWLGMAVLAAVFFLYQPARVGKIVGVFFLATLVLSPLILGSSTLKKMTGLFSERNESYFSVEYRKKLLTNSIIVIKRKPLLGSLYFLEENEMKEMTQGEGIIDIVNAYVGIALYSGLLGLTIFGSIFLSIIIKMFNLLKNLSRIGEKEYLLIGQALLAIFISITIMIGTVSLITFIGIYCWAMVGIAAGYIHAAGYRLRQPIEGTS